MSVSIAASRRASSSSSCEVGARSGGDGGDGARSGGGGRCASLEAAEDSWRPPGAAPDEPGGGGEVDRPKNRRATGRGTSERMRAAHDRLMEAISVTDRRLSVDGGREDGGAGADAVVTLLLAVLAPVGSLRGTLAPHSIVDVGGCTDTDTDTGRDGGCGAGCGPTLTPLAVAAAAVGCVFEGNRAARDARSRLGNKVGVRI